MDHADYVAAGKAGSLGPPDDSIEPDPVEDDEPPEREITESDVSPLDWDPRESLDDPYLTPTEEWAAGEVSMYGDS